MPRNPRGQSQLGRQIARIAILLEELDEMTRGAMDLPPALLDQARASIEKTRSTLGTDGELAACSGAEVEADCDPQPEVDREILERMYRDLNQHS